MQSHVSLGKHIIDNRMVKDFAISIVRTLQQAGYQAYLVGGCVRDVLLGREPADYDVATDATPNEVMRIFPDTYAVGAQFGVVLVPLPKNLRGESEDEVEVATFRSDIGYTDGRHPDEVRFSKDAKEDVARRDFTINGLLLDPLSNQVLDFVDGRKDLEDGVVRAIGIAESRFEEDKLRMLRAVRFASRFGYVIEPRTFAAIRKWRRKFARFPASGCGRSLQRCLPKATPGKRFCCRRNGIAS